MQALARCRRDNSCTMDTTARARCGPDSSCTLSARRLVHVVSKTARARCRHDSSDCMQHLLIRLISSFRPIGHQCTSGKALGMHAVSLRSSHLIFPSTYPSMSCAGSLQGTFVPQLSPPPSSLISMARARTDSCTLSARRLVHVVGMTASACYRHGSSRINLAVRRRSPRTIGQVTHVSGRGPSAHSAPQRAAASDPFAPLGQSPRTACSAS